MAKLTKAQKEFFTEFAKNSLANSLFPLLKMKGLEFTHDKAKELIDMIDVSDLAEGIGQAFLQRVSFTEVKRINAIMKSDEFVRVIAASHEVGADTEAQLMELLVQLIPADEAE